MFEITLIEELAVIHCYTSNVAPVPNDKIILPNGNTFIVDGRAISIINPERIVLSGTSK